MVWISLGIGVVVMLLGINIKPEGQAVEFGTMWGFAANSTPMGKFIYACGAALFFGSIYTLIGH